jgi:demethylmacrocin O-methyltransferase
MTARRIPSSVRRLTARRIPSSVRRLAGRVRRRLRDARSPYSRMSLTRLAQEFGSDKWGTHRYTPHYERHFAHLRDRRLLLNELGIGGYARAAKGGASLRMWKWFFPRAEVVGVDIEDKSFVDAHRITSFRGSQTNEKLMRRIVRRFGEPTIVIDDGSHRPAHVIRSFEILFPMLADGGLYVIEDIQTSYWPAWKGSLDVDDPTTSMAMVKRLLDGLNHEEFLDESYTPSYTDLHVVAVHCYHNLVIIEKGTNREGSNKRRVNRRWYAKQAAAAASPADEGALG